MTLFGGTERIDTDEPTHEWLAARDIPWIKRVLEEIEDVWDLQAIDLDAYAKGLEGTQDLSVNLLKTAFEPLEVFYRYRLGYIILHQLSYEPALSVRYEL